MNIINFIKCFFCGQQLPAIDSNVSSILFFDNCWLSMAIADQDRKDYWPRSSPPPSDVPGSVTSLELSSGTVLSAETVPLYFTRVILSGRRS